MEENILKNFPSEVVTLNRSQIHPADYNPRRINAEQKKALKRSLKKFGVLGGIIVNKQTGYTLVGGHQKVAILDEMNNYKETPDGVENDYQLRVEVIDVDERTEKTINVTLNNSAVSGSFDLDLLAAVVPDIEWKDAGLTEADLSMIGLDSLFQTNTQKNTMDQLEQLMEPVNEQHRQEVEQRAAEREAIRQASREAEALAQQEMSREDRVQHMKEVKQQVREQAIENAKNMDAYLVLSFSTFEAKAAFCEKYGFDPYGRTIKGEDFDMRSTPLEDDGYEDE